MNSFLCVRVSNLCKIRILSLLHHNLKYVQGIDKDKVNFPLCSVNIHDTTTYGEKVLL